jgi:hypothetical protein
VLVVWACPSAMLMGEWIAIIAAIVKQGTRVSLQSAKTGLHTMLAFQVRHSSLAPVFAVLTTLRRLPDDSDHYWRGSHTYIIFESFSSFFIERIRIGSADSPSINDFQPFSSPQRRQQGSPRRRARRRLGRSFAYCSWCYRLPRSSSPPFSRFGTRCKYGRGWYFSHSETAVFDATLGSSCSGDWSWEGYIRSTFKPDEVSRYVFEGLLGGI